MPREQIQRLSKRPSVETQAGQYGTGRTGVVNMPFVHQDTGRGQQLAKALGMAVETTGKIVQIENQKDQKKKSADHTANMKLKAHTDYLTHLKNMGDMAVSRKASYIEQTIKTSIETGDPIYTKALIGFLDNDYAGALKGARTAYMSNEVKPGFSSQVTSNIVEKGIIDYKDISSWADGKKGDRSLYHEYTTNGMKDAIDHWASQVGTGTMTPKQFKVNTNKIMTEYNSNEFLGKSKSSNAIELQTQINKHIKTQMKAASTSTTKTYTEQVAEMEANEVHPLKYYNKIQEGVKAGHLSTIKASTNIIKYANSWAKKDLELYTTSLTAEEKSIEASIENPESQIYLNKDEMKVFTSYNDILTKQVNAGMLSESEKIQELSKLKGIVEENRNVINVQTNFNIENHNNDEIYKTSPSKAKSWIKEQYKQKLSDPNISFEDKVSYASKASAITNDITKTWFPFTSDITQITEARKRLQEMKQLPGGKDIYNRLPTATRLLYDTFDVIGMIPGQDDIIVQTEADKVKAMLASVKDQTDFGTRVKDIKKVNEKFRRAVEDLPDSIQQDMALTYEYLTQSMSAKDAASFLDSEVRPRYIKEVKDVGTFELFKDRPNADFIGFHTSPYGGQSFDGSFGETVIAMANFKAKKYNIVYDDASKTITVTGKDSGKQWHTTTLLQKDVCDKIGLTRC